MATVLPGDRIGELLIEWEERREAGEELAPETLCGDFPELMEEVRKRIQVETRRIDAQIVIRDLRIGSVGMENPAIIALP